MRSQVQMCGVFISLVLLCGCIEPYSSRRGYPAPADVGAGLASRSVEVGGKAVDFQAYRFKAYSSITGAEMTLLIEPVVEVGDADAVAQGKLVFTPGPGLSFEFEKANAHTYVSGRYGKRRHDLLVDAVPVVPNTVVFALDAWELYQLFGISDEGNTLHVNTFSLYPKPRHRVNELVRAMGTWAAVYKALGDTRRADVAPLIGMVQGKRSPAGPEIKLTKGLKVGPWRLEVHQISLNETQYRSYIFEQALATNGRSGHRMSIGFEPQLFGKSAKPGTHNLQMIVFFKPDPEFEKAYGAAQRMRFSLGSVGWDLSPVFGRENVFIALISQYDARNLWAKGRETMSLRVTHEGYRNVDYEFETRYLGALLNQVEPRFFMYKAFPKEEADEKPVEKPEAGVGSAE